MVTETIDIIDRAVTARKRQKKGESARAKQGKAKKCAQCGMSTYQKDGVCVLCKTGLREAGRSLIDV